jgi:pimeloyl-ACP methyl ester carboxylesterase
VSTPCYITTGEGQVRTWLSGEGPVVVAVAGLTTAGSVLSAELSSALPGRRVVVVEPPGMGGAAALDVTSVEQAAQAVAESLGFVSSDPFALIAQDLSAALVPALLSALPSAPTSTVLLGLERAEGWVSTQTTPPDLRPRVDGTHLNALWCFLRDRALLDPHAPSLPSGSGPALPDTASLKEAFLSAAVEPERWAVAWSLCAAGLSAARPASVHIVELVEQVPDALGTPIGAGGRVAPPATQPRPGTAIWNQYVDTRSGRVHLRRAGSRGRPVLVLSTGGGSSAQFAPVICGLAESRTVFAMDYLGNGLSEKVEREVTAGSLAREAVDVLDALGIDEVDVWGSHTGACVGLELGVDFPERVGKLVLEAPVMVTPEFRRELLERYFPDFAPDHFGLHLQHVWHWRRDMFMYWPWYRVDRSAARGIGVPGAQDLHLYAVGILESGTTYSGAYRAGFSYDTRARLPDLKRPAILTAGPHDMLANALEDAASLAPEGMLRILPTPTTMWWPDPEPQAAAETLALYRDFLG